MILLNIWKPCQLFVVLYEIILEMIQKCDGQQTVKLFRELQMYSKHRNSEMAYGCTKVTALDHNT